MVSVPYLSLGLMSFMIYRGCKKNAAYFRALEGDPEQPQTQPPA